MPSSRRGARAALLVLSILALAACGGGDAPPIEPDAGALPVDAGPPPGRDAGPRTDAGPVMPMDPGACDTWGSAPEGAPLEGLSEGRWTWVDVPEAHCMDGSSTGFGVRLGTSPRLMMYLEGGGLCFDAVTCAGVANPDGFSATRFRAVESDLDAYGIFSKTDASNPFRDWTVVYVPYCSGDVHGGTRVDGFEGREQVGYLNVGRFLSRLVPTFRDVHPVERAVLIGASAGGLGALANYDQVQRAFECTPVDLIDDSGPILGDDTLRPCLQQKAIDLFGLPVPADCPQCALPDGGGLSSLWTYLTLRYPERRFALLSNTRDQTMRQFFGIGLSPRCNFPIGMSGEVYEAGLIDLRDRVLSPHDRIHTFFVDGDRHTFVYEQLGRVTSGGTTLSAWLGAMLDGDASWSNVAP